MSPSAAAAPEIATDFNRHDIIANPSYAHNNDSHRLKGTRNLTGVRAGSLIRLYLKVCVDGRLKRCPRQKPTKSNNKAHVGSEPARYQPAGLSVWFHAVI